MTAAWSRRRTLAGAAATLLPAAPTAATERPALAAYADPGVLARLPFGTRSHWLQPWRGASDTIPATVLQHGLGAVIENITAAGNPTVIETLSRHGIRSLRLEIGWGDVDYETESRFLTEASIRRTLLACRRAQVRPLILLNAHHARPVPNRLTTVQVASAVAAGERSLTIAAGAAAGVVPGRTGINNTTEGVMADVLVVHVERNRLHLSKPLSQGLLAGSRIQLATLKYPPFSAPGSAENEATLAGWLHYADLVANFAGAILSPRGGPDRGFDLEIWNELTFGSHFLSIANYVDPPPQPAVPVDAIWTELPARTAAHAAANPARYAGVALTNGFANTIPWIASSRQHPRIAAISKHPYPPAKRFPEDDQAHTKALGPDARPTSFAPSYSVYFPEYGATAIQTETLLRDVGAAPNDIQGVLHGRLARQTAGRTAPVDVWLTEIGASPEDVGVTDRDAAEQLKAKFSLRAALFFLGIGVARVYLFNASGPPDGFGLADAARPSAPTPTLLALARATELILGPGGMTPPLLMRLSFAVKPSRPDTRPIFTGGGASGPPPLLPHDCLVLLPFQRGGGGIALVYYVMTRDLRIAWPTETLHVEVTGLGQVTQLRAHDPMTRRDVPCQATPRGPDRLLLELEATDTPRILTMEATGRA